MRCKMTYITLKSKKLSFVNIMNKNSRGLKKTKGAIMKMIRVRAMTNFINYNCRI